MSFLSKIKTFIFAHKIISAIVVIVVVYFGWRFTHGTSSGVTHYIIGTAANGTIVSTVSGSGQVAASGQVSLKASVSGTITAINAAVGQQLTAGALIASIDPQNALDDLQNAKISLAKLTEVAKPQDILDAQNGVTNAYNGAWNAVSDIFLSHPAVISGMKDLFYGQTGYMNDTKLPLQDPTARTYHDQAGISFDQANTEYQTVLDEYNGLSRLSATSSLQNLVSDTNTMVKSMAEALKNTQNALTYIATVDASYDPTGAAKAASDVNTWLSSINSSLANILSAKSTIDSSESNLETLTNGADPLDIQSAQLSVTQKQRAYDDYFVVAPFNGVMATISAKVGDDASAGPIGTFISNQEIATISLNEVDAAKVQVGQTVTMTFDAIDGLSITGHVAEIDLVGTVAQGVVSYNVQIAFDTQDSRVRSGMSVNAIVATNVAQDVLTVPNTAIKTQGNNSYVQVFDTDMPVTAAGGTGVTSVTPPRQQAVTIGVADNTSTQILSGLKAGDKIVTRVVAPTTATTAAAAPSILAGARTAGARGPAGI